MIRQRSIYLLLVCLVVAGEVRTAEAQSENAARLLA